VKALQQWLVAPPVRPGFLVSRRRCRDCLLLVFVQVAGCIDGRGVGHVKLHGDVFTVVIVRRDFDGAGAQHFFQ
jgi:hypothetical protein